MFVHFVKGLFSGLFSLIFLSGMIGTYRSLYLWGGSKGVINFPWIFRQCGEETSEFNELRKS